MNNSSRKCGRPFRGRSERDLQGESPEGDTGGALELSHAGHKRDRKVLQLCSQAREALNLALAGECGDPLLQQLFVVEVQPVPGSNRLLVSVEPAPATAEGDPPGVARVMEGLERAKGLLRSAVAHAICRRRVPELEFRILPASLAGQEEEEVIE